MPFEPARLRPEGGAGVSSAEGLSDGSILGAGRRGNDVIWSLGESWRSREVGTDDAVLKITCRAGRVWRQEAAAARAREGVVGAKDGRRFVSSADAIRGAAARRRSTSRRPLRTGSSPLAERDRSPTDGVCESAPGFVRAKHLNQVLSAPDSVVLDRGQWVWSPASMDCGTTLRARDGGCGGFVGEEGFPQSPARSSRGGSQEASPASIDHRAETGAVVGARRDLGWPLTRRGQVSVETVDSGQPGRRWEVLRPFAVSTNGGII